MPTLTPSRPLRTRRRLPLTAVTAAIATAPFVFLAVKNHSSGWWWWVVGGVFAVSFVLDHLTKTVGVEPPEVSWDRDAIHLRGDDMIAMPWGDYAGYAASLHTLKLYRHSKPDPVLVDIAGLDDDQRASFLTELALHSVALPNKRPELTSRLIGE